MSYRITLQHSGESFGAEPGESILAAAKRQGITLPHGCDDGVCGACLYTIVDGRIEYPAGQPFALLDEDIEAGRGLCCVGHPASDMVIALEHPDEDFEPWS